MKSMILIAGLAALTSYTCLFQVKENEYAVVTRFGDPRRQIDDAGLHLKWPPPIDSLIKIDGRVHILDPEPNEYLTSDKKNIIVDSFLAWSVEDPLKYLVSVRSLEEAELRLTDVLRSVIGDVLSACPFVSLVSSEADQSLMHEVVARMTDVAAGKAAENFGIHVQAIRIKRLNFPTQNKRAVFRRMEAERESFATGFRSEGVEQYEKIKADANRTEAELIAEAERRAKELRGEADAEATRIYNEAYSMDPELYEFLRNLEMLENVLGNESTLILPSDHELLEVLQTRPPENRDGTPNRD